MQRAGTSAGIVGRRRGDVLSAIEQRLFGSRGTHALLAITLAERRIVVVVAPREHPTEVTEAVFEAAELQHVWASHDATGEEAALPWDIIGFDSDEKGSGRWQFLLNCCVVEFCWRSEWPAVARRQT